MLRRAPSTVVGVVPPLGVASAKSVTQLDEVGPVELTHWTMALARVLSLGKPPRAAPVEVFTILLTAANALAMACRLTESEGEPMLPPALRNGAKASTVPAVVTSLREMKVEEGASRIGPVRSA